MITHVSVQNYKSLADVDVELGPLTVLVGQNSTGKSNFIDVLHFISDALRSSLERAIMDRGGMRFIQRAFPRGRRPDIHILLRFALDEEEGEFILTLAGKGEGEYKVKYEKCLASGQGYEVREGKLKLAQGTYDISTTTLSLDVVAALDPEHPIRKVEEYLLDGHYYTIFPDTLRDPKKPGFSFRLSESGYNLGTVLRRMKRDSKEEFAELSDSLSNAVPGVVGIDIQQIGGFLVVKLKYQHDSQTLTFDLSQESDGTLRLLGIFTALYQNPPPSLITIEEPELTVHPGALAVLADAIKDASSRSQIIITTHSPDLISRFDPAEIRVVEKVKGVTQVAPLDKEQVEVVRDRLFSTGELMLVEGLRRQTTSQDDRY